MRVQLFQEQLRVIATVVITPAAHILFISARCNRMLCFCEMLNIGFMQSSYILFIDHITNTRIFYAFKGLTSIFLRTTKTIRKYAIYIEKLFPIKYLNVLLFI